MKKVSALLKRITLNHHNNSYCLNWSFVTYFWNVVMPSKDTKILEFNKHQKFDKASFIIYADLECLIEKINGCKNDRENPSTIKVDEHIPSSFSMSTI